MNNSVILWGAAAGKFLKLNLSGFIIQSILCVYFYTNRPRTEKDVRKVHFFYVYLNYTLFIVWAAIFSSVEYSLSGTYLVFVLSVIIGSGINILKMEYTIFTGLIGIVFLHVKTFSEPQRMVTFDGLVVLIAILVSVFLSRMNTGLLERLFLMDILLESKVEERTKELEAKTLLAQKSDRLKSIFLANMSHEIRTPLNGIIGFSELLKGNALDEKKRDEYTDIIISRGKNLLNILNDIIEVSRIEAGECEINYEIFSLTETITEAVARFSDYKKIVSGEISLDIETNVNCESVYIKSDRIKIIQIINNLLSNAIKYTEKGVITVSCRYTLCGDVEVSVADTGKGIREEDFRSIFERFRQATNELYGVRDGVGLGLTIVKGYLDLLGGRIELESEPGKGSIFRMILPEETIQTEQSSQG